MRRTVERELKLTPTEGFDLSGLGGVQLPNRDFVSTYFDTAELLLAQAGITLRHRAEGGARLWQLKVPSGAARIELEVAGAPARPPAELLSLLAVHLRGAKPARVARLRTRRKTVRMQGAEIVEDSVAVLDGQQVKTRFRELEVELVDSSDERVLDRLEKALLRAGAVRTEFRPKVFRALDLELVPEAGSLPTDATAFEVLTAALYEQRGRLLDHDPGTRLGTDPEDLHQMRVATRRARAFLRVARPLLDPSWTDELRAELGWLGSALGPARDLDVLVARMQGEISRLGDDGAAARGLLTSLERQRRKAQSKAVAALTEPRYLELLDRLADPRPPTSPAGTSPQLAELWWEEFARAKRRFSRLDGKSPDEDLHAARIRVKRARYAAELAASELGSRGERFVDAAKVLQDVLGEHQDATVAEERIRTWAEGKAEAADAVRRLLKRERARRKKARAEWPDAWKLLERRAKKARG